MIKNTRQRDQFNFYKSFDDVAKILDDDQLIIFIRNLLDVQFLRVKFEDITFDDKLLNMAWQSCRFNIENQVLGYLSNKNKSKDLYVGCYEAKDIPTSSKSVKQLPKEHIESINKLWDWYKDKSNRAIGTKEKAINSYMLLMETGVLKEDISKAVGNYVSESLESGTYMKHLSTFLNLDNILLYKNKKQESLADKDYTSPVHIDGIGTINVG